MKPRDVVERLRRETTIGHIAPTLSHWERYELLGTIPRLPSGRKEFTEQNYQRIKQVAVLRWLGLSVKETKLFLEGSKVIRGYVFEILNSVEMDRMPYAKSFMEKDET